MRALVLESFVGSIYADSPDSYEFPAQYLQFFEPLGRGEPMVAVIYEPRGDRNDGRMAYVGWALLRSPPENTGHRNAQGRFLYRIQYADRFREFDRVIPREATGEPIESWLRPLTRGRRRNVATVGRAVRPLLDEDLQLIFSLGFAIGVERAAIEGPPGHEFAESITIGERSRRLVSAANREARFRDEVMAAYEHRCSLSGLAVGASPSGAFGILDAAHIRPVGSQGADHVSNGLALTPTLHRLFDKGLFTLVHRGMHVEVRVSPRLQAPMIEGRDGFSLRLRDGLRAQLPGSEEHRPSRSALEFHQASIFVAH